MTECTELHETRVSSFPNHPKGFGDLGYNEQNKVMSSTKMLVNCTQHFPFEVAKHAFSVQTWTFNSVPSKKFYEKFDPSHWWLVDTTFVYTSGYFMQFLTKIYLSIKLHPNQWWVGVSEHQYSVEILNLCSIPKIMGRNGPPPITNPKRSGGRQKWSYVCTYGHFIHFPSKWDLMKIAPYPWGWDLLNRSLLYSCIKLEAAMTCY